jgi:hypothetical protein
MSQARLCVNLAKTNFWQTFGKLLAKAVLFKFQLEPVWNLFNPDFGIFLALF